MGMSFFIHGNFICEQNRCLPFFLHICIAGETTPLPAISIIQMKGCCLLLLLTLFAGTLSSQSNSMVRGVYKTFEDFKAGHTTVVDSFYLDSVARKKKIWLGTYNVTPRYVKNNKAIKKIWGFYDGKHSWIRFRNEFFPLEVTDQEVRFEAYGTIDEGAAAATGMLFGLVGAAIYSVAANEDAKGERVEYIIDPSNGNIYEADALDFDLLTVDEQFGKRTLVLYRATNKEMDEPMRFSVNDSLVDWFVPGSYYEMVFPTDIKRLAICFGNGFEDCETILFTATTQYVECTYTKKSAPHEYRFISVSQSEGEHSSVWSYDVQERREKKQRRLKSKEK
jgi:hypothetical protein